MPSASPRVEQVVPGPLADPVRLQAITHGVSWTAIATFLLAELLVALLAWGSRFIPGAPTAENPAQWICGAIALVVVQIPAYALLRDAVARRDESKFRRWYLLTNTLQITLIGVLCWSAHPAFALLGVLIFSAFVFNDAGLLYDSADVRWAYAFPPALLVMAAFVNEGASPRALSAALLCAAAVIVSQLVLHVVGGRARDLAALRAQAEEHLRRSAVLAKEQQVLRQACNLLSMGLNSAAFTHDLRGTVTVLSLSKEGLRDLSWRLDEAGRTEDASLLLDAVAAIGRLEADLTHRIGVLRSARPSARIPIDLLVDQARAEADERLTLERRPPLAHFVRDLQKMEVYAGDGHVSALANLLINSARYGGGEVQVRGRVISPTRYRLTLRDHGASPETRAQVLQRIHASFDFRTLQEAKPEHSGFGVALGLARLEMLRVGGSIHAGAPSVGPGIELTLEFLTTNPEALPAESPGAEAQL
jgi:signal transduction histidine kinase